LGQVPCRAGCSHCCIGIFPITRLDLRLIQEGLEHLPVGQRVRIETRAAQQIRALETAYPRLQPSPSLDDWPDQEIDRAAAAFHDAPCPALGDDGLCTLYDYRPLTCRSMGIPTRHDDMVNGACAVQTFVPIARLSSSLEAQEEELAAREAVELATLPEVPAEGEELLLPYAFLSHYQDHAPQPRPRRDHDHHL
jgi:Fe-S-cluster containining protein